MTARIARHREPHLSTAASSHPPVGLLDPRKKIPIWVRTFSPPPRGFFIWRFQSAGPA
jgi:hypothetical protein